MTTPIDSLFPNQWYFNLIGDIETVWNEYTGNGVNIGIYDNGIQFTHSDLDDNYNSALEVVDNNGIPIRPTPNLINNDAQGTAVAGIIAAEKNGDGTVGIAFGSSITGVNILDPASYGYLYSKTPAGQSAFVDVISQASSFDIMSNSWSKAASFDLSQSQAAVGSIDYLYLQQIEQNIIAGRTGLGTVVVQAAGDDGTDANGSSINASRFTISVAATDSNGFATEFTNFGSSIFITSPAANITTDLIGDNGFNAIGISETTGPDTLTDTDYTSTFGNTVAATPIVSGVIALMLDANSNLGWRDVQNILAISAGHTGTAVGAPATGFEHGAWSFNGATNWNGGGMSIHGSYGFGVIDGFAAVRLAEVWSALYTSPLTSANEQTGASLTTELGTGLAIPDNGTEATFSISSSVDISVEHLRLNLNFEHTFIGDIEIFLTDPSGSKIQIAYDNNTPTSFSGIWSYGVDSLLGVSSLGDWMVSVSDAFALSDNGTLFSGSIDFFGTEITTDNVYHFTTDFLDYAAADTTRKIITDTNGGQDWLNFATIPNAVELNLLPGSSFSVNGVTWGQLSTGIEQFENAITGDGNDIITGNGLANKLSGMRGNDTLHGGGGNDTLDGGADDDIFTSGTGADTVDGGAGIDTIDYSGSTNAQTINLVTNVNIGGEAHNDTLISIENLIGSDTRGDKVTGTAGKNVIHGMGAGDILRGFNGDDFIFGDANNDFLFGGRGADALDGGTGIDWAMYNDSSAGVTVDLNGVGANGFAQGDTYTNIENVRGSIHDDTITGDNGINKIIGDKGNDIINGMGGRDNIRGGIGNDTLDGGAGIDGLRGDAGDDVFVFLAGNALDNVLDFDDFGNDQVDLSSFGFATFADVQLVMGQAGGHVRIDLGGSDILLLRNTLLADMGADDFIL